MRNLHTKCINKYKKGMYIFNYLLSDNLATPTDGLCPDMLQLFKTILSFMIVYQPWFFFFFFFSYESWNIAYLSITLIIHVIHKNDRRKNLKCLPLFGSTSKSGLCLEVQLANYSAFGCKFLMRLIPSSLACIWH